MGGADMGGSVKRATIDAVAGAVAGGISRTIVAPLDVIKIRFQVQLEPTSRRLSQGSSSFPGGVSKYTGIAQAMRDIFREEGIPGLWRGNVPALLLVMPYTAIQFVALQGFRSTFSKGGDVSPVLSYVSGAAAGCAATIGSYPFDLLRTILASQGEPKIYRSMRHAFVDILQTRGFRGLYAGLTPSLVEIIPYAGLQFGSYDTFKRWAHVRRLRLDQWRGVDRPELSGMQHFWCGLAAGTFSKTCCHPLDVVKKRFQVEGLARHPRYGARIELKAYKSMVDAIRRIVQQEGLAGLYKGTYPSVIKAAPAAAITFVVYEKASKWLELRW
ncbi:hypothetical protein SELMODRAFT_135271 [Selaginella moellendorffii]|uniref:Uncharacterized protein n=1 Tax=Selaginella moellendorffii TaxID=88036 RepID=D8T9X1_SELML|nr:hypothetical protein SELMODRAFT_135271 [Selaginella moellendorffii]